MFLQRQIICKFSICSPVINDSAQAYTKSVLNFLLAHAAPGVVEKPGDNSLSRLKMLYTQAKELSEGEIKCVHHFRFLLFFFLVRANYAQT